MDGKKRLGSPLDANKGKEQRMFAPNPHFRGGTDAASLTSATSTQSASFHRDMEGAMRDTFLVDILKMDGEPFKGSVPRTEALKHIFVKALGFKPDEFTGQLQDSGAIQLCCSRQKISSILMKSLLESPISTIRRQSRRNMEKKLLKCHAQSGAFENKTQQSVQGQATPG